MPNELFKYMNERELIRIKKERGDPKPWTADPILSTYKFTNVKREDDRTTRWMRQNWTNPARGEPLNVQLFNCALFRYFGTVEFAKEVGYQFDFHPVFIKEVAKSMLAAGHKVFTGAYVITNGGIAKPKYQVVVDEYLTPLWHKSFELAEISKMTGSWQKTAEEMRKLPGFGGTGFMTKEVLLDAMQTPVLEDCNDRNTWCPLGPGARKGLNVVMGREMGKAVPEQQMLEEMIDLFTIAPNFMAPYMPELELHDIQFSLCETFKYVKVRTGAGRPRSLYNGRN
jgi:hypothetical protein